MDEPVLWVGTVLCAVAGAAGLLPERLLGSRARAVAVGLALALAPVLILADNWDSDRIGDLRDSPALVAGGLVVLAAALGAAALALARFPRLLAPALVAAMPFRVPVDLGGGDSNLLVPLYFVIAAGVLAGLLRGERSAGVARPAPPGALGLIGVVLAVFLVVYALQLGLADGVSGGLENVAFFLVPFAALFHLLAGVEWDRRALRDVAAVLVAEGLLFALVAGVQAVSGELFWNDKVIEGNEAHPYFRVNSLFWDPNILGRYLAVTMIVLAAVVAWGRERRDVVGAAAAFVVLLVALVLTYSQSSTLALIGGLLVLVAARWSFTGGVAAGVAALLALVTSVALIGGGGVSDESSGRESLVDGGIEIGQDHPFAGAGSGSFAGEYGARFGYQEGFSLESHTEPVTIFAEQGAIGLLAYLGLLIVTIGGLLSATGLRWSAPALGPPLAATLLAAYAALVVHSLGYAAFLTDPITWAVLAVAVSALTPARPPAPAAVAPSSAAA